MDCERIFSGKFFSTEFTLKVNFFNNLKQRFFQVYELPFLLEMLSSHHALMLCGTSGQNIGGMKDHIDRI